VSGFDAHNPMPSNLAHSDQNFVPWNHPWKIKINVLNCGAVVIAVILQIVKCG
jgi:hypothetical protein